MRHSLEDPFHLPPVLLAYPNPKPSSSLWTIWPKTRAPETLFWGRPGIEYLWRGSRSSVDWRTGWAFSCLTVSSRHLCLYLLLFECNTEFHSTLVLSGSRTSSLFCTCSCTSLALLSESCPFSTISFNCSDVSWTYGLIFQLSWYLSQCLVFHREATICMNIYRWNSIISILSIRTYNKTCIIRLPTILLSLLSSTCFRICQCQRIEITRCWSQVSMQLGGLPLPVTWHAQQTPSL